MGKNKTNNQRRKKAKKKKSKGADHKRREQKALAARLRSPKKPEDFFPNPKLRFNYISSNEPCPQEHDPEHELLCPYQDLKIFYVPDTLITFDTRETLTVSGVYLTSAYEVPELIAKGKVSCHFSRSTPRYDQWYRCLLPKQNELLQEWFAWLQEQKKKNVSNPKPYGPLVLCGTVIGFDDHGPKTPFGRDDRAKYAAVFQDVTIAKIE